MSDFPADWSPPDRDPQPLTHNHLDMVDRYMGGGRVSEAQGDGEIRVFDLTAAIRRLRGQPTGEPTEADAHVLSPEDFEHYRKAAALIIQEPIPPLSDELRRAAYEQLVAICDSHEALRLRVVAAPTGQEDHT